LSQATVDGPPERIADPKTEFVVPDFKVLIAKLLRERTNEIGLVFAGMADECVVEHPSTSLM